MKTLKRSLCIVLSLMLVLSLAACATEININVNCDQAVIDALTGAGSKTTQAAAPVQTTAPATNASQSQETTAASTQTEETTAASSDDTTAKAPETTKAPESKELSASSTKEEVVAKYIEVYNATKADGTLKGSDAINCESVYIDGKQNSAVTKLANSVMTADATNMNLPPYTDDNPGTECATTADDIKEYAYTDNGDGTATIKLVVKESKDSRRFQDPAGNMLNVMEDVASALANISVITWAEGDANSNTVLTSSGYCEVTYDKSTNLMTKAEYVLYTTADVQHANVLIFKDKSAQANFKYVTTFPG